ncbi:G-type lectin S-receptor-like serine/threonine-protein kinase At1g11300 isoform X3 [Carya illinoinensis]|uniref:G-type lectin S-receptor-like serine/threonine-protein kinase At1g11300 isoform X3 n=1 Tax=Carya illinoinensis TaxID=32201 RepID=UPI001C727D58|nr:G-type lectin S-receptor-like serine/threonine-protein kinase At1g11300 isoform X3 [Carya illinoinensis]
MGLVRSMINLSYFLVFLSSFCLEFGHSTDTITALNFIKDSETIVSNGGRFLLGFFSPPNSTYRYVGIWYAGDSTTRAIWVANRNKPLKTTSGILTISEDGNLAVLDGEKTILWSSYVTSSASNMSARLLDTGNLVLQENTTGLFTWESFQHPSDSWFADMKLGTNATTGKNVRLTSWKSPSDPAVGTFSFGTYSFNLPEMYIWNGSSPYFRSGPWNGMIFIGSPTKKARYAHKVLPEQDKDGSSYFAFDFSNGSAQGHVVLNAEGNLLETSFNGTDWVDTFIALMSECDVYGKCGEFGNCNPKNKPICSCLEGFEPKNIEEWSREDWTSGCVRRTPLQCMRINTGGQEGKKDGFSKVKMMQTPSLANWSSVYLVEDECRYGCLEDCSCLGYAYVTGIGCMVWTRDLIDLRKVPGGGVDLYVRLAYSDLDKKEEVKVIVIVTVIIGIVFMAVCTLFLCRWRAKRKEGRHQGFQCEENLVDNMNQDKLQELPIFSLEELASATNNFHPSNKLGQGGFGPVYKGKLLHGQEIAVKRLARNSGQGLEEFKNEVIVISKLQHRNLVRLFGGCVEGEEKLLVYEYMPNKSLDTFLFELNPKISDFGMARIFGGNEDQANTKRVVGTYGYMSPEYAMEGRFSEKSDVFSFGVLLLEIVSGRKNTHFYHDEGSVSLLGLAWKMWNIDNLAALVDPKISGSGFEKEILRCIHVGLLCVQEFAKDRPTIPIVISMLRSEIVDLPYPRQPGFAINQIITDNEFYYPNQKVCSINNVTVSMVHGR